MKPTAAAAADSSPVSSVLTGHQEEASSSSGEEVGWGGERKVATRAPFSTLLIQCTFTASQRTGRGPGGKGKRIAFSVIGGLLLASAAQLLQVNAGKCLWCAEKDHGRPSSFTAHEEVQKFKSCCRISHLNSHYDITMLEWEKKKKGRPAECRSNRFFFFFLPSLAFVRILLADLSADSSAHADRVRVPNAKMSSDHTVGLIFSPPLFRKEWNENRRALFTVNEIRSSQTAGGTVWCGPMEVKGMQGWCETFNQTWWGENDFCSWRFL